LFIKEYEKKYEKKVLDLFETVFTKKISENYWSWRLNEFGDSIRYIMIEEEKVIGHYVVHPIPLEIFGKKTKALFSMSVMTHPEFRGKGVFSLLATEVYKKAISLGYEIIFGFPNVNSASIHFDKLKWKNHGKITEYVKNIQTDNVKNIQTDNVKNIEYDIVETEPNNQMIEEIWNKNKEKFPIIVPRTSAYIKWRFFSQLNQSSENNSFYKLFIVKKNNIPKAYFILKYFNSEKVHIVEFFGDITGEVFYSIINYASEFSKKIKIKYLSFWLGKIKNKEIENICNNFGFIKCESTAYFGIKNLIPNNSVNANNWHLTMSDSDIF